MYPAYLELGSSRLVGELLLREDAEVLAQDLTGGRLGNGLEDDNASRQALVRSDALGNPRLNLLRKAGLVGVRLEPNFRGGNDVAAGQLSLLGLVVDSNHSSIDDLWVSEKESLELGWRN